MAVLSPILYSATTTKAFYSKNYSNNTLTTGYRQTEFLFKGPFILSVDLSYNITSVDSRSFYKVSSTHVDDSVSVNNF